MKREEKQSKKASTTVEGINYGYLYLTTIPRKQWVISVLYGGLSIALSTVWPFLLYRTLNQAELLSKSEIVGHILFVTVLLGLIFWIGHLQAANAIRVLKTFTHHLIDRIWKKMNALDWLTFHGKSRVYYFDMLMVETWRIRGGVSALLETIVTNSLIACILSLFVLFINWPLFLVFCGGLIIMGSGQLISALKTRPLLKAFHKAWRAQHLWVAKSVDQFDLIKMDRGYDHAATANAVQATAFLETNSKLLKAQAKGRNLNQFLSNLVRIGVFILGIYWVQTGALNLNELLLGLLVISVIQTNLMQLPAAFSRLMEAQESFKTVTEFFELPNEPESVAEAIIEAGPLSRIRMQDLCVSYGDNLVLDHLTMELESGKIYLWKGKNGSGKSTAVHTLLGLLQPQSGSLSINGVPRGWTYLRSLRHRFAFLNQDSPIFMGSIEENIFFGHQDPTAASEILHRSWLRGLLPASGQAEQQWVGERGEGLSGGESKRIALIREMLRKSELIVLDEPLNHLDEFAIQEIKRELLNIKQNAIVVIISHQSGFEEMADETLTFS